MTKLLKQRVRHPKEKNPTTSKWHQQRRAMTRFIEKEMVIARH
jgi:hypothetical protein